MKKKVVIPNPTNQLNVIRRYLHTLALLQNNKESWNSTSISDILSLDEPVDGGLTDKTIRGYIKDYLIGNYNFKISMIKGSRTIELEEPIEDELLEKIANIYSSFVVFDSSKNNVIKTFIKKHRYDCLWMMARIYFAIIEKRRITFDYTTNSGYKLNRCDANPYHMIFRNNNLYLVAKIAEKDTHWRFLINRIEDLEVTDEKFTDTIPAVEEMFKYSLGSFDGPVSNVRIRFHKSVFQRIEQALSIIEPDIREIKGTGMYEAEFATSDTEYLFGQLFMYGKNVEILEPAEMRAGMKEMLEESLEVYKG